MPKIFHGYRQQQKREKTVVMIILTLFSFLSVESIIYCKDQY